MSHPLLNAPIGRSLFRLAGPTTAVMVVQIGVAVSEAWFVAQVGIDALAGIALVIPFITLMMNMANGGMGGGVASALARALGGGRAEDAKALLLHALVLAAAMALLFGVFAWTALPTIFRWLGGNGEALRQALAFSYVWFSGAIAPLITGTIASLVLARALARGRLGFVPRLKGVRLQSRLFVEILRVGAMGSVTTVTATMTAMLVTGLVGRFGTAALAGYSIGMRLEFMVAPLAFGIGTGATTLVGIAAGAHDWRRAVRVAWVAGLTAFAAIGVIGWTIALMPETWSRLFAMQPEVIAASIACIVRVAPFYCLFGLGLTLNFASQGAGRMTVPVVASLSRLVIAAGGGWFAVERLSLGLEGVFGAIAASLIVYGGLIAGSLLLAPWRAKA